MISFEGLCGSVFLLCVNALTFTKSSFFVVQAELVVSAQGRKPNTDTVIQSHVQQMLRTSVYISVQSITVKYDITKSLMVLNGSQNMMAVSTLADLWSILYQVALYSKDLSDNVSGYCGIIIICRVLVLVYLLSQLTRTFNVIKYKFQVILMCIYIEFHSF